MPFNTTKKGVLNCKSRFVQTLCLHMFRAIYSGVLDEKKHVSDIIGECQAEACTWKQYTTLAVCASVDETSSSSTFNNKTNSVPGFHISGTTWEPPALHLSDPDTFWMTAPFKDPTEVRNGDLPSISDIFVAYYPPCNDQSLPRGDYRAWKEQLTNVSNWKAYRGSLNLCLQTLYSTYNTSMETTIIDT